MTGRTWLAAVGVGLLLAGSGCVSCGHEVCKKALEVGPTCGVPACDGKHVYAVLVNGLIPNGESGLDGLRDQLACRGFTKVYSCEMVHGWWVRGEMKRVARCDPAARFVVVGYDLGCGVATGVARAAVAAGLSVDAVLLLDPVGKFDICGCPAKTVLVRCGSNNWGATPAERVVIDGANHFTIPAAPQTAEFVAAAMKDSAAKVLHLPADDGPEWRYDNAPPPRPTLTPGLDADADWLFLSDPLGPHTVPLSPVPAGCGSRGAPGEPGLPTPPPPGSPLPLPLPKKLGQAP